MQKHKLKVVYMQTLGLSSNFEKKNSIMQKLLRRPIALGTPT
jgi:hypothetical protein